MATSGVVKETLNVAGLSTSDTHEPTFATNVPQSLSLYCSSCMGGPSRLIRLILPRELHFHGQPRRKLLQERHPGTSGGYRRTLPLQPYRGREVILVRTCRINGTTGRGRWINEGTFLEQESESTQRTPCASAQAVSLLYQFAG